MGIAIAPPRESPRRRRRRQLCVESASSCSPCLLLRGCFLSLALVSWKARPCLGSNWAQAAGPRQQNYAFPYENSPTKRLFSPRSGHATLVLGDAGDTSDELLVLGGDDYAVEEEGQGTGVGADNRGSGSYRNDVWAMRGSPDFALSNSTLTPIAQTLGSWEEIIEGRLPPSGVSYEEWISCQDSLVAVGSDPLSVCGDVSSPPGSYKADAMWSPRRGHAVVEFRDQILVLGGRSREHSDLPRGSMVGGLLYPPAEPDPFFSSWHERSILRNDVWASRNGGRTWKLLTPGCTDPQEDLVLGPPNVHQDYDARPGSESAFCNNDADCYGVAECRTLGEGDSTSKTCICPMWSPREAHTVVTHGSNLYVLGGFTSVQIQRCGIYSCGSLDARSQREYMSDIWVSQDGASWTLLTPAAPWSGRGDHAISLYQNTLILMGGTGSKETYLNDVWQAPIEDLTAWQYDGNASWGPRGGMRTAVEYAAALNGFEARLYLSGGHGEDGIYDDLWSRPLESSSTSVSFADGWVLDYSQEMAYRTTAAGTTGFVHGDPPQAGYVDPNSPISALKRVWLPESAPPELGSILPTRREYETPEKMALLEEAGIYTIADMASADLYTILHLRGFSSSSSPDYNEEVVVFGDEICGLRELALAVLTKCQVDATATITQEEYQQAGKVPPIYGGAAPTEDGQGVIAKWYVHSNWEEGGDSLNEDLIASWDGCSPISGITQPNVPGIGVVSVPESVRDPHVELQELNCITNPGKRTHHGLVYYAQSLLLLGGRTAEDALSQDVWIRDDRTPTAFLAKSPADKTPGDKFEFTCDEPACIYEVRVFDNDEHLEVLPWTRVLGTHYKVSWLNKWDGGAGDGNYIFYVRAIDPAGNTDYSFRETLNMYRWHYVSPLPWGMIWGVALAGTFVLLVVYTEYRRRKKKRAMEKYALKRMRRKFKQQQKNKTKDTNWRDLYDDEEGGGEKKKGKKNKKESREGKKKKKKKSATTSEDKGGSKKKKKSKKKEKERKLTRSLSQKELSKARKEARKKKQAKNKEKRISRSNSMKDMKKEKKRSKSVSKGESEGKKKKKKKDL